MDAGHPAVLNAFATLARRSQRLSAFPLLKTAFWVDVLQPTMMSTINYNRTTTARMSLVKIAAFPEFVIEFSIRYCTKWCSMNELLGEQLLAFMAIPTALLGLKWRLQQLCSLGSSFPRSPSISLSRSASS